MTDNDLAIYIHWPFCVSKCPYCDFNSHVSDSVDPAQWRAALLAELEHFATETKGRRVTSVYFGGGTPSLMAPATTAALIDAIAGTWPAADDLEITLEANPSSAEIGRFRAFRDAGVNRLSIGVQSLDDAALQFLGRAHDAAEGRRAIDAAASVFERFSFDLIYGLPGQNAATWRRELREAAARAGDHLSAYQLTIEPGTRFFRDRVQPAAEDDGADMFEITQALLSDAGLPAYEVSNHARPGGESRHNLTYWRGGDYLGIGPGAHGRLSQDGRPVATHQVHDPTRWLTLTEERGHGTAKRRQLSAGERAEEMIMTGLRMAEGLDLERLERRCGLRWADQIDAARIGALVAGGFVRQTPGRLSLTPSGMMRLNALLAVLLAAEPDTPEPETCESEVD